MPTSVRLDAETQRLLQRMAERRSQTKSQVMREAIRLLAEQEDRSRRERSPFEAVADLLGSVSGGSPDLSTETGKRFRELLLIQRRDGR